MIHLIKLRDAILIKIFNKEIQLIQIYLSSDRLL